MNIFDFMIESRKTIYPSYRILVKKRFDNIDKQYNTVNRMKRVVKSTHYEYTESKAFDYKYNHYKSQLDKY